ncbi:MAG: peptide deformylase [Armatimonadota bacterium]|nr:peptide deformylase [Armatimonadota bacterium]
MPSDEIVLYGDAILTTTTKHVDPSEPGLKELVDHMIEVMRQAPGVGLAANQIGVDKHIFVYDVGEGPAALLNPKIIKRRGSQTGTEGCLSVPGLQGEVRRASSVVAEGLDIDGNKVRIQAEGLLARVFQHEIDHLNGHLFIDRADPDTLSWVEEQKGGEQEI